MQPNVLNLEELLFNNIVWLNTWAKIGVSPSIVHTVDLIKIDTAILHHLIVLFIDHIDSAGGQRCDKLVHKVVDVNKACMPWVEVTENWNSLLF